MSVVVPSPLLDQDRRFFQGIEDLHVQQLVSELTVETFAVAILPGTAGLDEQRADIQPFEPVTDSMSAELWPVVRSDMVGRTMGDEQLGQQCQHVIAVQPSRHQDRQTFPTELVNHHQHPKRPSVMRALLNEVVSPDVMAPARSKPDAGAVIQPEPAALGLPRRNLQPFLPPNPRHALGIHMPALGAKQCRDPAIAVTSKLAGKIDDRFRKRRFIAGHFRNMPLRRASLAKHTAGPAFGYTQRLLNMMHVVPTTGSAQKFPDAASFRMSLSSVRSATAFLSRAFSRSSSFRRLA